MVMLSLLNTGPSGSPGIGVGVGSGVGIGVGFGVGVGVGSGSGVGVGLPPFTSTTTVALPPTLVTIIFVVPSLIPVIFPLSTVAISLFSDFHSPVTPFVIVIVFSSLIFKTILLSLKTGASTAGGFIVFGFTVIVVPD